MDFAMSFTNLLAGIVLVGALSIFLLAALLFGSPSPRASRWRAVTAVALIISAGLGAWYAMKPAETWVSLTLLACLIVAWLAFFIDRHLHMHKTQRKLTLFSQDYPDDITTTQITNPRR